MLGNLLIANEFHDRYSEGAAALRSPAMPVATDTPSTPAAPTRLGRLPLGWTGWVTGLAPTDDLTISWAEMERRLLEMGLVEGARIEVLHEGPIGGDPIAVRVDDLTVALRRREADVVLVSPAE